MNTYCHIEEFGENRYNLLPIMAYCFNHSIIWAPNLCKLQSAHNLGKSYFSAGDILELIESHHIQIMARRNWFYKDERLKRGVFQSPGWVDGIDDRICDYALEDENKPFYKKRVIIAPEEKGKELSEKIMGSTKHDDVQLVEYFAQQIENKNIPARIQERIHREGFTKDEAIMFLIRSAHNNNDAFLMSRAHVPAMSDHSDVFLKYMEENNEVGKLSSMISPNRLQVLLESLEAIMSIKERSLSSKNFKELIFKKDIGSTEDELATLADITELDTRNKVLAKICSLIRADMDVYELKHPTKGKAGLSLWYSVVATIYALIEYCVEGSISTMGGLGLCLAVGGLVTPVMQILRILPENHMHFALPYLLVYGKKNVHYRQMQSLYNEIKEVI